MKTMDRYVAKELAPNFLFGVAAFSTLLIAGNLLFKFLQMVSEKNVPVLVALEFTILKLPALLVLTFPMAMLLGTLLAMGRMSGDAEVIALKASGASFLRISRAALLFGLGISLLTVLFTEVLVPRASLKLTYLEAGMVQKGYEVGKLDSAMYQVRKAGKLEQAVIADTYDPKALVLNKVTLVHYDEREEPAALVTAAKAEWQGSDWVLTDCTLVELVTSQNPDQKTITAQFARLTQQLQATPEDLLTRAKSPEEMTFVELRRRLNELSIAATAASLKTQEFLKLKTQLYTRTSLPFTCLVFVMIGAPLGVRRHRTGASLGLGLSVLIIFGYYLVMHFSEILGQSGRLEPFIAAWLANFVFAAAGLVLAWRANN